MGRSVKRLLCCLLCLCVCAGLFQAVPSSAAADAEITKVLSTAVPTPVALMDVGNIPAATSTQGCYVAGYNWYDSSGNIVSGKFGTGTYRVKIRIDTYDGYVFSPNVTVYLNNGIAAFDLDSSMRSLTLYRDYTPDVWMPEIFKHPGNETVDAGGDASFVVSGDYTSDYFWTASPPDDSVRYDVIELREMFEGLMTEPQGRPKMNLYNVPAALDGWHFRCDFKGPGVSKTSNSALLTVRHTEPEPVVEAEPEATEAPPPDEAPKDDKADGAQGDEATENGGADEPSHTHEFSSTWHRDETSHWKECACGERTAVGEHEMEWSLFSAATKLSAGIERGVCLTCGETGEREIQYTPKDKNVLGIMGYVLYGIGILIAIVIVLMIITAIRDGIRRNRRRRRRRRRR